MDSEIITEIKIILFRMKGKSKTIQRVKDQNKKIKKINHLRWNNSNDKKIRKMNCLGKNKQKRKAAIQIKRIKFLEILNLKSMRNILSPQF